MLCVILPVNTPHPVRHHIEQTIIQRLRTMLIGRFDYFGQMESQFDCYPSELNTLQVTDILRLNGIVL